MEQLDDLELESDIPDNEADRSVVVQDSPEKVARDFTNYSSMRGVQDFLFFHNRRRPSKLRFKRVVDGMYHWGTHKVFMKIVDEELVLRSGEGGKELSWDEFLDEYEDDEAGKALQSNLYVNQKVAAEPARRTVGPNKRIVVDEGERQIATGEYMRKTVV